MSESPPRPPGRPRNVLSREALIDAAYWQAIENDYRSVSVDSIAKAAGSGKQTLYRWWPSKGALVLEAVAAKARARIDRPREAAMRAGDVEKFLVADLAALAPFLKALKGLIAEANDDAAFARELEGQWLTRRVADLDATLAKAIADPRRRAIAAEAIEGAILSRLVLGRPLDEAFARALASLAAEESRAR
jgi:AcrR family transcriptional regulator